ncbi:hypothetical protein E2C01_099942 [Portunus trituberculatus]|uniref:Uncharacterized protein n=1 Tax=Portunus trituberculatus TaxID=210409 RepID=A0A5B7KC14_PORTR|nr:hypothetical protein [Portunus trituberculatus]
MKARISRRYFPPRANSGCRGGGLSTGRKGVETAEEWEEEERGNELRSVSVRKDLPALAPTPDNSP